MLLLTPSARGQQAPAPQGETSLERATSLRLSCIGDSSPQGRCRDAAALSRLAYECHRRTSIAASLAPTATPLRPESLFLQPLLLWQASAGAKPPSEAEALALGAWLVAGGMLLIDPAEPAGSPSREAFVREAEQTLTLATGGARAEPIDPNHVLFRSFYLLRAGAPNVPVVPRARGLRIGGRLAVVISEEPWLSAIATDEGGAILHPDAAPASEREVRLRMAINWLMYTLCLDYKDDQVHLPYLLQRRGQ